MRWQAVSVAEIAKQVRGVSYDKSQTSSSPSQGFIPILRAGNIQDGSLVLNQDLVFVPESCVSAQQLLRPGDIVVAASSGSLDVVGKAAQIQKQWQGSFGAFCKVIRPTSEKIVPRYLHHFFQSSGYRRKISSLAAGANINNLKNEHINDLEIPLPPLEEQRRIAAILDKGRATKRLAIAASNRFESLRLSIFEELFDQTTWPTASLQDVTTRITNGYVGPTRDVYVDEGIPYLLARHVKNGQLSYCGNPKISATFNEKNKKSKLKEGDVLLVQSGHIGSSCVVPPEHHGHNCHAMIVITPMKDFLLGEYLSLLFQTQRFQRLFQSLQTGITVPHLNCRDIRKIQVPMPPIEKQVWLSERISTLSAKSMVAINRIDLISELEKSLMEQFLGFK